MTKMNEIFNNADGLDVNQNLELLADYYQNTGMVVVGAIDSLGIPYTVRGKKRQGFSEMFVKKFRELGIKVTYINAFSMCINKTLHLDRILKHNLSVAEIKKIQELGIDYARKGLIKKIVLSKGLKNMYSIDPEDFHVRITDELHRAEQPIFFYSCGINNIMHKLQANPISILINKETREQALRRVDNEKALLVTMKVIAQNFENIYSINPNTNILCMGIYMPYLIKRLNVILPELKKFEEFVNEYNGEIKKLCSTYNATFIDNSYLTNYCGMMGLDSNFAQECHNSIALNAIDGLYDKILFSDNKARKVPINQLTMDNKGLRGMIEDANFDYFSALSVLNNLGSEKEFLMNGLIKLRNIEMNMIYSQMLS